MLCGTAQVIPVAAKYRGFDANNVPVGSDLVWITIVQSEAATADLHCCGLGGAGGAVDEDVDTRSIPSFSKHCAGGEDCSCLAPSQKLRCGGYPHAGSPQVSRSTNFDHSGLVWLGAAQRLLWQTCRRREGCDYVSRIALVNTEVAARHDEWP